MKAFFEKPSVRAFLVFTGVYAFALMMIFWGAWSLDKVPVAPDCMTTFPVNDASAWFKEVLEGKDVIPSDLMHVIGGRYFWVELQFALAAWLAALGVAFYLCGQGLSLPASYGGGSAFGLMGYCFTLYSAGHLGWFVWLMYGPFAFGLLDRAVRKCKWRNWILLGAVLAWGSARQPDLWLIFTVVTFAYGVWCLIRERKTIRWGRTAAGVALTALCALTLGWRQFNRAIFHDIENRKIQISESSAKQTPQERWLFCTSWSLPPEDTLEFAVAEIHGGSNDPRIYQKPGNKPYSGRLGQHGIVPEGPGARHPVTGETLKAGDEFWLPYRQHSLYFGWIALLLALAGCFWKGRDKPFWIGVAVIAYLCALGGFTPFYKLIFALPFGDLIRCPVKFVHVIEFSVAVLVGFGIEFLRERFGGRKRAWVVPALTIAAVVNVFDLARIDARYLAVQDISFLRAENAAAEDAIKCGGGKVFVAVAPQEGGAVIGESLRLHLAETADVAEGARFLLANGTTLRNDATIGARMKSGKLKTVGMYALSQKGGITRAGDKGASLILFEIVSESK